MRELWEDIEGFNGRYSVSVCGRVIANQWVTTAGNTLKAKQLKPGVNRVVYGTLALVSPDGSKASYYVHRLVAQAFYGPQPANRVVNHINEVTTDNHIHNLEYVSRAENYNHSFQRKHA